MNYNETHIQLLQTHYGYTERAARFLWLVAHFSGTFIRHQFIQFLGTSDGHPTQTMIDRGVDQTHLRGYAIQDADPRIIRYHLYNKPFYRNLGQPNSNYRRDTQSTELLRIRLFALDYVLANLDNTYLLTEPAKTEYFTQTLGIASDLLPGRTYGHPTTKDQTFVPFVDKAPIFIDESGTIHFAYIDDKTLTSSYFETHLDQYSALLSALTTPWSLTLVCWEPTKVDSYRKEFERRFLDSSRKSAPARPDSKLIRYFELTTAVEEKRLGDIGKDGILERIALAKVYDTPANKIRYADWKTGKEPVIQSTTPSASCRFDTFVPPSAVTLLPPSVPTSASPVLPRPNPHASL
jgi:hypothetical protein